MDEEHVIVARGERCRAIAMDSLTHANDQHGPGDVLIGASFLGVLTAHWAARYRPRAIIAHDCGVGLDGFGISGLWYLDAARIPAATAAHSSARVGDGESMFGTGHLSYANHWAEYLGCGPGMTVQAAVEILVSWDGSLPEDGGVRELRETVYEDGRGAIVAMDSIRFAQERDRDRNVVCVGSHGGATAGHYALEARPKGFVSSDGGIGRDDAGIAGLVMLDQVGIPGAAVSVHTARIGVGRSTYEDGIISTLNESAAELGIRSGMRGRDVAVLMLSAP